MLFSIVLKYFGGIAALYYWFTMISFNPSRDQWQWNCLTFIGWCISLFVKKTSSKQVCINVICIRLLLVVLLRSQYFGSLKQTIKTKSYAINHVPSCYFKLVYLSFVKNKTFKLKKWWSALSCNTLVSCFCLIHCWVSNKLP